VKKMLGKLMAMGLVAVSGTLRELVTFAEIGKKQTLHPQNHKNHQEWASCRGG
jgi:hypothetical protein